MRPSCKRMPTKLCMMVEAGADHPGVPALLWLPVVQGLLPFNCQSLVMGRGSTQEPPNQFYFFTVATICIFAETMNRRCILLFSPKPHRRLHFDFFVNIMPLMYFDDVFWTWRPCRRTSIIWRCIVDFFVSYLICMFQDSVPAGSLKWSILV